MSRILFAAAASLAFASAAQAGTQTISLYENGALPATVTTSGTVFVDGTQGYAGVTGATNGKAFGADFIRMGDGTASTTFALSGLAGHTSLSLDFLLAAIDSLDGTANDGVGPDFFSVAIDLDGDGTTETTLWNYNYLNCDRVNGIQNAPAGGTLAYRQDLFASGGDTCFFDSAYDMGVQSAFQNIAHTLSTLTLTFGVSNLQNVGDESYGIDALSATLNGTSDEVPEPAMLGLFGLGALGLGLSRRRRA